MGRKKRGEGGEKSGDSSLHGLERRQFLKMGMIATGGLLIPKALFAHVVAQVQQKVLQKQPKVQKQQPTIQQLTPAQKNTLQRDLSNALSREWDRIENRYVMRPIRPNEPWRPDQMVGPSDLGHEEPPSGDPMVDVEQGGIACASLHCDGDEDTDTCTGTYYCIGRESDPDECWNYTDVPTPDDDVQLTNLINNFVRTNFQDLANLYGTGNKGELFNHVEQMLYNVTRQGFQNVKTLR